MPSSQRFAHSLGPGLALASALLLAACAGKQQPAAASKPAVAAKPGVKIGKPYQVFGRTYVPVDDRDYDATGIASWYGPTFHQKPTATGEIYDQDAITAAHKTLPMPSFVEVINLDNGRTLTVRINDRGPFVEGRIIDLSRRSAELLGVDGPGLARVRVRRVFPEGDWARAVPPGQLAVAPVSAPAPPAGSPGDGAQAVKRQSRFIQVAALSEEARAQALASVLADFGPAAASPGPTGLWRVRVGPIDSAEADAALLRVRAAGYPDARLVP